MLRRIVIMIAILIGICLSNIESKTPETLENTRVSEDFVILNPTNINVPCGYSQVNSWKDFNHFRH